MKIETTPEELALILDGLATLPLARSYNLFTRLMGEYKESQAPSVDPYWNANAPGQQP